MKNNNAMGMHNSLHKNSFGASFRSGFTLIEMLTVVLIIGILTAVVLPQYRRAIQRSRATEAIAMLRVIYDSGERLAAEFGYRSFADMALTPQATFSRMDMFDQDTIACPVSNDAPKEMRCEHFTYTFNNTSISAASQKLGVTLRLDYPVSDGLPTFVCTGNKDTCEVFGFACPSSADEPECVQD